MKKRSVVAALLLAVFSAGMEHSSASGIKNPRAFALRLTDMPVGFTQAAAIAQSNAQAEKADRLAKGTLTRHGRLAGFETDFKRTALLGMTEVDDSVLEYSTPLGAQWQMVTTMQKADIPYQGQRFHRMSIGSIGDQSVGYLWTGRRGGYKLTLYVIAFRRGSYATAVTAVGLTGTFGPEAAIHMAHIIDNRIRSGS
jgi:hypothetical protein